MNLKITVYTIKFSFFLCIEKSFPFYWQKLSFSLLIEICFHLEMALYLAVVLLGILSSKNMLYFLR